VRRAVWAAAAAVLAAAAAVPLATAEQTRSQEFFKQRLLAEESVSPAVKELLRSGGFVDKSIKFSDLTGDDKDDAVVRVHSGGAPGVVAVYVFSTDTKAKGSELVPVFRSEKLLRASTNVTKDGVVSYRYSRYGPGNELCCPRAIGVATLGWDADAKRFKVVNRVTLPGPTP
jgi:hypothetical protein